jgi:uncharacterized membrane protein YphA (DoxX/SURF4 family)
LRAAVGVTVVLRGAAQLGNWRYPGHWAWVIGLLGVLSGASLIVGAFTPVAGAIAGLSAAFGTLQSLSSFPHSVDASLPIVFLVVMAASIVLLGPGAFSVDARLFGRREISIPPSPRRPDR